MTDRCQVLLISGSLRRGSTNTALLRTAQLIAPEGITAALYDGLDRLPHFDPDLDRSPLPDTVAQLRAAVHDADAILFCTPEYAGALPGSFKNVGQEVEVVLAVGKPFESFSDNPEEGTVGSEV